MLSLGSFADFRMEDDFFVSLSIFIMEVTNARPKGWRERYGKEINISIENGVIREKGVF